MPEEVAGKERVHGWGEVKDWRTGKGKEEGKRKRRSVAPVSAPPKLQCTIA